MVSFESEDLSNLLCLAGELDKCPKGLDSIEIVEPQELKDIIDYKIEKYHENKSTNKKR